VPLAVHSKSERKVDSLPLPWLEPATFRTLAHLSDRSAVPPLMMMMMMMMMMMVVMMMMMMMMMVMMMMMMMMMMVMMMMVKMKTKISCLSGPENHMRS
jgi:hypothetical protein